MKKGYLAVALLCVGLVPFTLQPDESRFPFADAAIALDTPADHLSMADIKVFSDRAVINRSGLVFARVQDTHSMEPTLNKNTVSLELPPASIDDINAGDIISYRRGGIVIIHRVIAVGEDAQGWYATTKGDNNQEPDTDPVRFETISGVVVGILH